MYVLVDICRPSSRCLVFVILYDVYLLYGRSFTLLVILWSLVPVLGLRTVVVTSCTRFTLLGSLV